MTLTRKSFFQVLAGAIGGAAMGDFALPRLAQAQEKSRVPARSSRLRDIEIFPFTIPFKRTVKIALGTDITADSLLVRIRTEDGVIGYGEASPYTPVTSETQQSDLAVGKSLAEMLRGRDPFTLTKIVADMNAFTPGNGSIKAALEMALWDICGKVTGQPICRLLGCYRESFESDLTVGIDTPQVMAEGARDVVRQGFKAVKIKVGVSQTEDVERVKAIRQAVGPRIQLRIDANQGWSPAEAVHVLRALADQEVQFCEQPVVYWDWQGLKFIRNSVNIPIMVDESVHAPHDAIVGIRENAMDIINIKLMKAGGILESVRIAQIADAADLKCMVGCMSETRLGLTAAAHVVASQKNIEFADLDAFLFLASDPVVGGMEVKDGVVGVPQSPGLGLDVDPTFLKNLRAA